MIERHYRPSHVARLTGLALATVRKKILRRELGYRKAGRAILIPEGEVERLIGEYRPALPSR